MQSYSIISGFSDIKSEIRTKTRTTKSMDDLRLWFSLVNGVLYAHDYDDHKYAIAIAIKTKNKWHIILDVRSNGHRLILDVFNSTAERLIITKLTKLYETHGYYR